MQEVKVLGISGSPRKGANTAKLVKKALEGATSVQGVETELYELAGKKIHHCIGCLKCYNTGACAFKDDFQDFVKRWMEADGIILAAPVYRMGIPGVMQAALERFSCSTAGYFRELGRGVPRYNKVCGVLTVGATRYGGQEMVLNYLMSVCVSGNSIVVSGDTLVGSFIGAAAWQLAGFSSERTKEAIKSKDNVLNDGEGIACAINVGKRVAEMTKIVKAGMLALGKELPDEYFYAWKELA